MLAEFHFRIGQGAHTSKFIQSGKNSMSWCDDEVRLGSIFASKTFNFNLNDDILTGSC